MSELEERTHASLDRAQSLLAGHASEFLRPEAFRLDAKLPATSLAAAAQALSDAGWGTLSTITGLDLGVEAGTIEVLYHLCEGAAIVTLRVSVPRDEAAVPSLCAPYPSASMLERELMEMLGVRVDGTPNTDRLFLPDDWPDGVYPLRQDFRAEELDL